jgi:hypothetical protein
VRYAGLRAAPWRRTVAHISLLRETNGSLIQDPRRENDRHAGCECCSQADAGAANGWVTAHGRVAKASAVRAACPVALIDGDDRVDDDRDVEW